ncbi:MAG: hypothetical protein JNK05_13790 [Myxococcales bacterium]|nr:hypothetical protein [Myxococcales bacterium]
MNKRDESERRERERTSGVGVVDGIEDALREGEAEVPRGTLGRLVRSGRQALRMRSLLSRASAGESLDVRALAELVEGFGEMKGVAMKAGQMLGYLDAGMPEELRRALALLQRNAQPTPIERVAVVLREALGARADALLARMAPAPVAVASIGQVYRGEISPHGAVAIKVQHPGVRAAIEADFRASSVGKLLGTLTGASTIAASIDEAREAFLGECDYRAEARWQQRYIDSVGGDRSVIVPRVYEELCAETVLVTQWVDAEPLDRWIDRGPSQRERDAVGAALYRFWVRTLYEHGLFHADPHPGNIGVLSDGRVVVYDYGCVRAFAEEHRAAFASLARAARSADESAIFAALEALGAKPAGDRETRAHALRLVRGFFGPMLTPGARVIAPDAGADMGAVMRDKRAAMRLALPGRMLFLFRLRFGLFAVLARLGASLDWAAMESEWARGAFSRGPDERPAAR